jgi:outer membrane protein assembly factor BamD
MKRSIAARKNLACVVALTMFATACSGASPLLTADPTGTLLFEQGQDALVAEDWKDAVTAFDTLLRNYPSSPFLAEARLGMGRGYYEQGKVETLIMAIDSFQGFLTYHPSHEFVDYAQYMVGMTYVEQMRTADRDQGPTRQAIEAFDRFISSYPDSPLLESAVAQRQAAIDRLAEHEYQVARWQAGRNEDWDAAIDRAEFALDSYPETSLKCQLYFVLGEAHKQGKQFEDAVRYYEQVVNEYPDCEYVDDAKERLRDINGVLPAALRGGRVS